MQYGRLDADEDQVGDTAGLPAASSPFPQNHTAAEHLRWVFGRMGLTDQEMVALSGGHTLGRAYKNRSGEASMHSWLLGSGEQTLYDLLTEHHNALACCRWMIKRILLAGDQP
jgi:hypothetical protein